MTDNFFAFLSALCGKENNSAVYRRETPRIRREAQRAHNDVLVKLI
jgi:hypothetical protein